jgi:arginase
MGHLVLLGAPLEEGAGRPGCRFGPAALRIAGLLQALELSGHLVTDFGDVHRLATPPRRHPNRAVKALAQVAAWTTAIDQAVASLPADTVPIILGGDHGVAAGSLTALERKARATGRPLFVLWLDAHADFHTLVTTESGNLHGVPLAYATGRPGFAGHFPPNSSPVSPDRVCLMGLRSVDAAEREALAEAGIVSHDMAEMRVKGAVTLLQTFLARVVAADGILHVTLDTDFLDPSIAPAVGTAVACGPDETTVFAMMEAVAASGRLASFEIAELNPLLEDGSRTARLLVDLATTALAGASAFAPIKDLEPCLHA